MTEIAEVLNVAHSTSVPELAVRKQLCRDSAGSRLPEMLTELFSRVWSQLTCGAYGCPLETIPNRSFTGQSTGSDTHIFPGEPWLSRYFVAEGLSTRSLTNGQQHSPAPAATAAMALAASTTADAPASALIARTRTSTLGRAFVRMTQPRQQRTVQFTQAQQHEMEGMTDPIGPRS